MEATQQCSGCGEVLPLNREYFGSTPSGKFRTKCRKCMAAHTKAYDDSHPENRASRSKQRSDRGGHIVIDRSEQQRLITKQKGFCLCCGGRLEAGESLEVDHVIPISKGGTHDKSNLAIAHAKCNTEKHAKTLEEHWAWRKKLGLAVTRFRQLRDGTWIVT